MSATPPASRGVIHGFVDLDGERYYRISHVDTMPTFFMNVVSSSEWWLFAASNGALTTGRINASQALFPYTTVDKIYDNAGVTGPCTALRVATGAGTVLWEPLAPHTPRVHPVERHLYKSFEGDRVWWEESHLELGLAFRQGWMTAGDRGVVRRAVLRNNSDQPITVELADGLRNLMVPGIVARMQNEFSNLADAYKSAERVPDTSLAVFALACGIVDQAIPLESLRATAVWSTGLPEAELWLADAPFIAFVNGATPGPDGRCRGGRATYVLHATITLAPGETREWMMVADTGLDQSAVAMLRASLLPDDRLAAMETKAAADASTAKLRTLVGRSDGFQVGADETVAAHHFANVLFNIMRGGVFWDGYRLPGRDFAAFVQQRNKAVATRHGALLAGLPEVTDLPTLRATLAATDDVNLVRLGDEYLPLIFSRRHGDPSRPWNKFNIHLRDAAGRQVLNYEGNWRDIFQNWEALCLSHPDFLEPIVTKFLNASTVDGYNPYRLMRAGLEWEAPEPEDPWATIGYWGDHQTIYLLRLLEWSGRFHPGRLHARLRTAAYTYADVPYRISDYDALRRDPRATITFDESAHAAVLARVATDGTDAKLRRDAEGRIVHVNLTEKLLLLGLTRLTNFVPGAGIWMNTQRPEWNDANNALVGFGVSVVTLAYLRRYLAHCAEDVWPALGEDPVEVSAPLVRLLAAVTAALEDTTLVPEVTAAQPGPRRSLLDRLAAAGAVYRAACYAGADGGRVAVAPSALRAFTTVALRHVDHSLRVNRRPDGLYHGYNLLRFTDTPPGLEIVHLNPMLEGQVAVLSAGVLAPDEAASLLATMRGSTLYRPDQHSYLLYPDRTLPGFLARNVIPPEALAGNALLSALVTAGDTRLVVRDTAGDVRFHPDLVNAGPLDARLEELGADASWSAAVAADANAVRDVYEMVFDHRSFTGRSGSMFGFEGLGCIYWHMVSKLLLAVQENWQAAEAAGDPAAPQLGAAYTDVRTGLGFNKTPEVYGAFPTDPYSHTPGHSGAQQPGMTGQVKEEIITRLGELGVEILNGAVHFDLRRVGEREFTTAPTEFVFVDGTGKPRVIALEAGMLGFTFCGVPVIYRRGAPATRLELELATGDSRVVVGSWLDAVDSADLFTRSGRISRVDVRAD